MFRDPITMRIDAHFKKLKHDQGISFREKCAKAREILFVIYCDQELCITENLIRRSHHLQRPIFLWHKDRYYTRLFELEYIKVRMENILSEICHKQETLPQPEDT